MLKWRSVKKLWEPFQPASVSVCAAAASFYLLLSILPASLLLSRIIQFFPMDPTTITQTLEKWIPGLFAGITHYLFSSSTLSPPALLSISAVTILWSASKGVQALMDGINTVLAIRSSRGYLYRRFLAMAYFLLLVPLLLLFPVLTIIETVFRLRLLIGVTTLTAVFSLIYRFFPMNRISFRFCIAGAAVSSVGWILFSWLFTIYVNFFSNMHTLYGSIGILILLLLWLHISLSILLYGCIFSQLISNGSYHPLNILKNLMNRDP